MELLPSKGYYYYGTDQRHSKEKLMDGGESTMSSPSKGDKKLAVEAPKSHKEAERRRRQRINAHLSTLRSLLPNTTKTDKASLLAEVVHRLKELKSQTDDVARTDGDGRGPEPQQRWQFPGESDEATLSYCNGEANMIRVSICCEDRPGLNRDLSQAIRAVRARMVRAEMMTVGGRSKSVLVIEWASGNAEDEDVRVLERALKAVVENRLSSFGFGQVAHCNKRARILGFVKDSHYEFCN